MSGYYSDTHPDIERIQFELIRSMPAWKKIVAVDDLNEDVRTLTVAGIKQEYPHACPETVKRLLADRLLGPKLAAKVYGAYAG